MFIRIIDSRAIISFVLVVLDQNIVEAVPGQQGAVPWVRQLYLENQYQT